MYLHHLPLYFVSKANIPPRGQEGQTWTTEPALLIQYSLSVSACSFAFTSFAVFFVCFFLFPTKFLRGHFCIPDFIFLSGPRHSSATQVIVAWQYRLSERSLSGGVCAGRKARQCKSQFKTRSFTFFWSGALFASWHTCKKNAFFFWTSVCMRACISVHTFMHSLVRVFVSTPFRPERHESSLLRVSLLWPVDRGGPSQKYAHH